jgi:hypothetical protein
MDGACFALTLSCALALCGTGHALDGIFVALQSPAEAVRSLGHLLADVPAATEDLPAILALSSAVIVRRRLHIGRWPALLVFAVAYFAYDAALGTPVDILFPWILLASSALMSPTSGLLFLAVWAFGVLHQCGPSKADALATIQANPGIANSAGLAAAPFLTVAWHMPEGSSVPRAVIVGVLVLQQFVDWRGCRRWARFGAATRWLAVAGPAMTFAAACTGAPRMLDWALFIHASLCLRRLLASVLQTADWLVLAIASTAFVNLGWHDGTALQPGPLLPQRLLAVTSLYLAGLDIASWILGLLRGTAHCDVTTREVELRSEGRVYAFSEPEYGGRVWALPPGAHDWGWLRTALGYRCRALYIPNGLRVQVKLDNGSLAAPIRAAESGNLPPELVVKRLLVEECPMTTFSPPPPDVPPDQARIRSSRFIGEEEYQAQARRTRKQVAALQRTPEYQAFWRARLSRTLLQDLPLAVCIVAQLWFLDDPDARHVVTVGCACAWAAMARGH